MKKNDNISTGEGVGEGTLHGCCSQHELLQSLNKEKSDDMI